MCPPGISFIATPAKQRPVGCGKCWSGPLPLLCNYSIKTHFYSAGLSITLHSSLISTEPNKLRPATWWTRSHDPRSISGKASSFVCTSPGNSRRRARRRSHELSSFSLKTQTPDALALGRPIILKIIGHLTVH